MSIAKLQEELAVKHIIVNACALTAQQIVNTAEDEQRKLSEIEKATIAGLLRQVEILIEEAVAINDKIQRWGN